MKYIALLRGINVGGNRKVEMKRLKAMLESMGYTNVSTYLNSGNAMFESNLAQEEILKAISKAFTDEFGYEIPILIKTLGEIEAIVAAIPVEWQNNKDEKTDVAFLFPEIDSEKTIDELPVKREYVDFIYIKGAIIWHIMKKDYNKSQLNKLVGRKLYQLMTVRNVNTARFLGDYKP